VISATASPVTRRVFLLTFSIAEENTTFGVSHQFRANSERHLDDAACSKFGVARGAQ
jgi:hypothetical protein